MAINWTAKLKTINGIEQIHFSVKSTERVNKISGCFVLNDEDTIEGDLVEYLKTRLGNGIVTEYENEAENILDEIPMPLQ